ncbi:DUF11 domain-containing protein [Altererythrobacter aestiaquae]|uniref:DUF11 domain-containing protein n=2 Tax=Pontixanthobacter aestiaquae TaxID=1509367 RepID=A0A844Z8D0_9SPHN|nr:DUF11 domain-containing protein [Pontixanthobacter aestiaquae]
MWRLIAAVFVLGFAQVAQAQTTTTYVNGVDGTIDGSTTCAAPLVRTFVVGGSSFTVADVDLGFFATHTWRGDIQLTLESPDGTRVQLVDGDATNTSGDNLNVLLDDAHGTVVNTDAPTEPHSTTAPPPFANNFSPNAALSAFNGVASAGTWRLEICDIFTGSDDGVFRYAELYLTSAPPFADLSLTKTVSNATPANGTAISYTLTVSNAGAPSQNATGVQVRDILPDGFIFVSAPAAYDSGTGIWTVGSVPAGTSTSITINGTVNATSGATVTNTAEIIASAQADIDSTVDNGVATEDDYATSSFTVAGTRVAGTPPNLDAFCAATNQILFDWQGRPWTNATNNDFTQIGIGSINYDLTTDVAFVAGSPAINSTNTGGLAAGEEGLFINLNNETQSDEATIVMTLPTAVPGMQFTVFDIDFGNNSFADKLTVVGSFDGTPVMPTLTNGIANYVTGNVAIGDAGSSSDSADGNVVVTFLAPVDTVTISYGNHTTAPVNPENQFMTIHDINHCGPETNLSVTKVSSIVSDPVNLGVNPKALQNATVRYCILISNAGSATATSVVATDNIPSDLTYSPGTIRSGTSCGTATTVEDDNNVDNAGDEDDPFGASISGSTLTMTAATLGPSDNMAITFEATIN